MKKITDFGKKYWIHFAAALLPALLCVIAWGIIGLYPGSSRTFLSTDLELEYYGYFQSLRQLFAGKSSVFYNWTFYMGDNIYAAYTSYLFSPWSLLVLLWDVKDFSTAFYFISLIKIALCGLTFSIFLAKRPIRSYVTSANVKLNNIAIVAFSTCYALMSYNMKYLINSMWIDTVYMLPLVLLGIERIIVLRRMKTFYFSATLMLFMNYYTALMAAIFSVLYFVFYYFCFATYVENNVAVKNEKSFTVSAKAILMYIFSGLCAVGTSMLVVLPTVYSLSQGKLDDNTNDPLGLTTMPIWKILSEFFYNSYDSITNESVPPVFCTSFCVIFAIIFIVIGLKKKSKIVATLISIFLVANLWITPLNRIWSGFRDPICFPYRYAFVVSCFFVVLGFEGFIAFSESKFKFKKPVWIAYGALTIVELFLCIDSSRVELIREVGAAKQSKVDYMVEKYDSLVEQAQSYDSMDNDRTGFYRFDKEEHYTLNDGMVFSYNGIQSCSSVFNLNYLNFFKRIGLKQDDYESYEIGRTIIGDSLLGIKYYSTYNSNVDWMYSVGSSKQMNLYYNPYAMSLGYLVDEETGHIEWSRSPADNQNAVLSSMLGREVEAFTKLDFVEEKIDYDEVDKLINPDQARAIRSQLEGWENRVITLTAKKDGHIYFYSYFDYANKEKDDINSIYNEYKQIYLNGRLIDVYSIGGYNYFTDLGYFTEGDTIEVIITNCSAGSEVYLSEMNDDIVTDALDSLKKQPQLNNINIHNGNMSGEIETEDEGLLFLSIPYDRGWTIFADGEKQEINEAFDAFCSIKLESGKHTIEMRYISPWFMEGLYVSIISVIVFIGGYVFYKRRKVLK